MTGDGARARPRAAGGPGRAPAGRWGRRPEEVLAALRAREWDDPARLRARLLGERPFPIRVPLAPPTGDQAIDDLERFRRWVESWRAYPHPDQVRWETRRLRRLGEQALPVALEIGSVHALATALGPRALARANAWEPRLAPLLALADAARRPAAYRALVRRLDRVEALGPGEVERLARLVPQLRFGLGRGAYLRALPLEGVDTKFVEEHETLLGELLDALHDGAVAAAGNLRAWLGCHESPGGWLAIRPLCEAARRALGDLPILMLPMQHLAERALPASRLLVVENLQSGLALPALPDAIAVAGTGRNLAWLGAPWVAGRRVGYWGDIDSWGLQMLGEARERCPHLEALMMDRRTLEAHRERAVREPESCVPARDRLTAEERALADALDADGEGGGWRLEQERLSADWTRTALRRWVEG